MEDKASEARRQEVGCVDLLLAVLLFIEKPPCFQGDSDDNGDYFIMKNYCSHFIFTVRISCPPGSWRGFGSGMGSCPRSDDGVLTNIIM